MKTQLRFRFFLWLLLLLFLFIIIQAIVFTTVEVFTWQGVETDGALRNHLMEVVIGVGLDFVALPLLMAAAWWISSKMVEPVKTIAATARRIGAGALDERIAVDNLTSYEMCELGTTINMALDHQNDAMKRLKSFSGDASHQLRTPLAVMRTTGEVALAHERKPDEYRETIGSMLEDLNRLTRIVDQLLLLARLDNAGITDAFTPIPLNKVIEHAVEFLQPLCDEKQITLSLELAKLPMINGCADLLTELISNLLDNAIRHTPKNGRIQITLIASPETKILELTINDSGSGIPENLAMSIFERFKKAPDQTSGNGLGLAIVSDIARIHRASIELLTSSALSGACFKIKFPTQ